MAMSLVAGSSWQSQPDSVSLKILSSYADGLKGKLVPKQNLDKRAVLFDQYGTRMTLAQSNPGNGYNWVFLPGGPGTDSGYFNELVAILNLPGNVWLVDLPENGGNKFGSCYREDYDFDSWEVCLKYVLNSLGKVILVGHSFSGVYPLLFPEIEQDLLGLVIIASASKPWVANAMEKAKLKNLPSFEKEMGAFLANKTEETWNAARKVFVHYYFTPETFKRGTEILFRDEYNFHAMNWWLSQASSIDFDKILIPNIPTLIMGSLEDCAVPFESYLADERFQKPNILMREIQGAGHLPWLEKPEEVKRLFVEYVSWLQENLRP